MLKGVVGVLRTFILRVMGTCKVWSRGWHDMTCVWWRWCWLLYVNMGGQSERRKSREPHSYARGITVKGAFGSDWTTSPGEWTSNSSSSMQGILLGNEKDRTTDTLNHVDEVQMYCVKWEKPDPKSTYAWVHWYNVQQRAKIGQSNRPMVARGKAHCKEVPGHFARWPNCGISWLLWWSHEYVHFYRFLFLI